MGFGIGFTMIQAKLDAHILLDFAIHHRPKKKNHEVEKASCENNACSQHGVMRQTDAIGLRKCDLGLPFHLLSPRQLQQ
jgi:hypothetical protein